MLSLVNEQGIESIRIKHDIGFRLSGWRVSPSSRQKTNLTLTVPKCTKAWYVPSTVGFRLLATVRDS